MMENIRSKHQKSIAGKRQTGVALVTALLIVALATVAAVAMTSQQQLNIRKTSNILIAGQNYLNALGGEQWAVDILLQDLQKDKKDKKFVDTLSESWAKPLPPIPLEDGGKISGKIVDLHSRFNVNNLYISIAKKRDQARRASAPASAKNEDEDEDESKPLEYFRRMLQMLKIDEDLADTIADWIDEDADVAFPDGAEDETYMKGTNPYRTPGRKLLSVSEIRLVKGVTDKVYQKLLPYIVALPSDSTRINVNTVPAMLLRALNDDLDEEDVAELIKYRDNKTFKTQAEFIKKLNTLIGKAAPAPGKKTRRNDPLKFVVDVNSMYFEARVKVEMGRARMYLNSIIQRDKDKMRAPVITRSRGVI